MLRAVAHAGSGSLAGLFLTLLSGKLIAVLTGPAGIGLLSLLRQLRQTAYSVSTVSGQTALVQGGARRTGSDRLHYLATVGVIFICATAAVAAGMIAFAQSIARLLFGEAVPLGAWLVRLTAVPVLLGSAQFYANSLLMVRHAMGRLAVVQVGSGLVLVAASIPTGILVREGQLEAFVGLMTAYAGSGLFLSTWLGWRDCGLGAAIAAMRAGAATMESAGSFFRMAGTMVVTAAAGTGTLLAVRGMIAAAYGLQDAGLFDAAWTMCIASPVVFLAAVQGYYLPLLSAELERAHQGRIVLAFFSLTIATMVPALVVASSLKSLAVSLLYSGEFASALSLVRWLIVAFYLRATAWVLTVPILADGRMRAWFWYEIGTNLLLLIAAALVIRGGRSLEMLGTVYTGIAALGALYGAVYNATCHYWQGVHVGEMTLLWTTGLVLVAGAAADTWVDRGVRVDSLLLWLVLGSGLAVIVLRRSSDVRAQVHERLAGRSSS